MLYIVGWNTLCSHNIISNTFSVGFLVYSVAQSFQHKQCSVCKNYCPQINIMNSNWVEPTTYIVRDMLLPPQ